MNGQHEHPYPFLPYALRRYVSNVVHMVSHENEVKECDEGEGKLEMLKIYTTGGGAAYAGRLMGGQSVDLDGDRRRLAFEQCRVG